MRITLLFTFLLIFLSGCAQEKQVIIESAITEIQFSNPYKFNSVIEEELKKDTKPWKHQTALLLHQKKGDYKKYPAALVDPKSDNLSWFLDEAAASSITSTQS